MEIKEPKHFNVHADKSPPIGSEEDEAEFPSDDDWEKARASEVLKEELTLP